MSTESLQKEITKLKEELKTMKQIEVSKDQQIAGLNNQLKSKNNEIAALKKAATDNSNKDKDSQLIDKEKELEEKYKNMSAALEQKINSLEMRITQLNHEKNRIDQSNIVLTKQLKEKEEEIIQLKGKGIDEDNKEENKEEELKEEQGEVEEKQGEDNEHEVIATGESQQPDKQTSLQYEKIIKEKETELLQSKEQITYMTNEIAVLTRERENMLLSLEEAKNQSKEAEVKMAKMRANVTEIKRKVEDEMIQKTAEINKANEKRFADLSNKNKNLEDTSKAMKETITTLNQEKNQYEEILLKQEDKIKEMIKQSKQTEALLQRNRKEIKEGEKNMQELMKIIKGLKKKNEALQITREEMDQTEQFQKQIDQLKILLDMKDSQYAELLKKHKILQMNYKKVSSHLRMEDTKLLLSEAREMKKKRDISKGNKIKKTLYNSEKDGGSVPKIVFNKEQEQDQGQENVIAIPMDSNNNLLLSSSNDFAPSVILPPLKMKTPSLLNLSNLSNEGEERKELNQMMSKIINEFV